jgi:hypothetical protein
MNYIYVAENSSERKTPDVCCAFTNVKAIGQATIYTVKEKQKLK